MTGRDPAPWMLDAADYITEMCCRRHPYEKAFRQEKALNFKFAAAQFHTGKRTRQ